MRTLLAALSLSFLAQGFAVPGFAQGVGRAIFQTAAPGPSPQAQTGTVVSVDPATMNFVCKDGEGIKRYWVTRMTGFSSGRETVSFFGLSTGHQVEVMSHPSGGLDVADQVVLLN
ncbi:MAG TPA: hypothetical protein VGK90_12845 [Rhizomicrobium sp.]|jgi:hypothetical protein